MVAAPAASPLSERAIIERVITVVDRLEGAAETFKAASVQFLAILTAAVKSTLIATPADPSPAHWP